MHVAMPIAVISIAVFSSRVVSSAPLPRQPSMDHRLVDLARAAHADFMGLAFESSFEHMSPVSPASEEPKVEEDDVQQVPLAKEEPFDFEPPVEENEPLAQEDLIEHMSPVSPASEEQEIPRNARVHRRPITQEELFGLRAEERVARSMATPWQSRGPPGPDEGGPSSWRGQQYRPGTGKWANRGGRQKEYYTWLYSGKAKGKAKDKGKGKEGKGKDKAKDKGKGNHGK
jgi:hypothetical protein